jgi:hypothetical protein
VIPRTLNFEKKLMPWINDDEGIGKYNGEPSHAIE